MTRKQKMKHRNVALRFTSTTGMMGNMNKQSKKDTWTEKKKIAEPENKKEEEIEKNEEITMVEFQLEDNETKSWSSWESRQ